MTLMKTLGEYLLVSVFMLMVFVLLVAGVAGAVKTLMAVGGLWLVVIGCLFGLVALGTIQIMSSKRA